MENKRYVLITSAHNEEENIEKTIKSVISQTILPKIWIIVSDRSNDKTDDIIISYAKKFQFIDYFRISEISDNISHNFSAKVNAINKGLSKLRNVKYDYIGILDADISFDIEYFEKILNKFESYSNLGIAGGNVIQFSENKYIKRIKRLNSVAGAVQMFRKECINDIGGFIPLEHGSEDGAAEITARMKGWEVKTFPEIEVIHYGIVGSGSKTVLKARFRRGRSLFDIGFHPLYLLFRCIYRMKERPILIGSIYEFLGYLYSFLRDKQPKLSSEVVTFLRREQKKEIKRLVKNSFS